MNLGRTFCRDINRNFGNNVNWILANLGRKFGSKTFGRNFGSVFTFFFRQWEESLLKWPGHDTPKKVMPHPKFLPKLLLKIPNCRPNFVPSVAPLKALVVAACKTLWGPYGPYQILEGPRRARLCMRSSRTLFGAKKPFKTFARLLKRPFRGLSQGLQHWLIKGTPRALISSPFWGLERLLKQVVMLDLFDVSCYLDISLCCSLSPLLVCLSLSRYSDIYIYINKDC